MCENLEIIATFNLLLRAGEPSEEIVIKDLDGDMFFTFLLKHINDGQKSITHFEAKDDYHGVITVETAPNAQTKLGSASVVGSYDKTKDLLINFVVSPADATGEHSVVLTFYVSK